MSNTYILVGEEIGLKEDRIDEIRKQNLDYDYNKMFFDSSNSELKKRNINEIIMYLSTIDMFGMKNKMLHVVLGNAKLSAEILSESLDYLGDNILIIDIRSNDAKSLTSSAIYKKNKKCIVLEKYNKLEEKNRDKTINQILEMFKIKKVSFVSVEDELMFANAIYDSSSYSYAYIKQQIEQLSYISSEPLSMSDIEDLMIESFNGNYYLLINKIFACKNKFELIEYLESVVFMFDKAEYISFFNIFSYTIKDYIRYSNNVRCKNGANFYQFKGSLLRINDVNKFLVDISNLGFVCRTQSADISEDLIQLFIKYFEEK